MGKFLRVLVVFIFLFGIAALVLGLLLFQKRELLKGRTQMLERKLIALTDTYIEAEQTQTKEHSFPAKDVSDCEERVLNPPDFSAFWDKYKFHLEDQDLPKMQVATRTRELMTYYLRDPVETYFLIGTHVIMRDDFGNPIIKGDGTMQNLLDEILAKAAAQYARLNETRQQLREVREELIATIEELNRRKVFLRERLVEIVQLKETIRQLRAEIAQLKAKIQELEDEIKRLNDRVAEQERKITELEDTKVELENEIKNLKAKIKKLMDERARGTDDATAIFTPVHRVQPGGKGNVVAVNPSWNFVVVELDDKFLHEVLGDALDKPFGSIDLMIRRPGDPDTLVTKTRLNQVRRDEKLGLGDILTDWQQLPVKEGDVVFY